MNMFPALQERGSWAHGHFTKWIHCFPPSHTLWAFKKGILFKATVCHFLGHFHCYIQKQQVRHSACPCFMPKWNTEMTSQSRPILLCYHPWAKKAPTSLFWKGTTSEGKIQGQKLFHDLNQGSSKSLLMPKKFEGFRSTLSSCNLPLFLWRAIIQFSNYNSAVISNAMGFYFLEWNFYFIKYE